MIEPSMNSLMQYLINFRKQPNMMPPVQQTNPLDMLAQQMQPQHNPIAMMLAQQSPAASVENQTIIEPVPAMLGTGAARSAGDLLQLQKMAKEAALKDDWDTVDKINAQIQAMRQGNQ